MSCSDPPGLDGVSLPPCGPGCRPTPQGRQARKRGYCFSSDGEEDVMGLMWSSAWRWVKPAGVPFDDAPHRWLVPFIRHGAHPRRNNRCRRPRSPREDHNAGLAGYVLLHPPLVRSHRSVRLPDWTDRRCCIALRQIRPCVADSAEPAEEFLYYICDLLHHSTGLKAFSRTGGKLVCLVVLFVLRKPKSR